MENHEILLTTLRWIDAFFEICPEEIMPFVPSLLTHVLPRMSHDLESIRQAAIKVNASLMDYIMSLSDNRRPDGTTGGQIQLPTSLSALGKELTGTERRDSNLSARLLRTVIQDRGDVRSVDSKGTRTPTPAEERGPSPRPIPELDYQAAVNALTLQFLNEHEATRVAAIAWLIMLHRMAPGKVGIHSESVKKLLTRINRFSRLKTEPFPRFSRRCLIPPKRSSHEISCSYLKYRRTAMIHILPLSWLIS